MKPRIHVLTLAVDDLERSLAFYRELGLESPGVVATEFPGDEENAAGDIVVLELDRGFFLALYPRGELAKDAKISPPPVISGSFSIGHAVAAREEVDALLAAAEAAGATLTVRAYDRPFGVYSGYFQDPDGHRTYVYSRELPPSPRIDLVEALGVTYVSSQSTAPSELAASIGNIDLIYEAVGHSHFALEVLRVLGQNGIYVLTGVPGLQAFVRADPAGLMRQMVLRNQVLLGTVNAGPEVFASAIEDLHEFKRRWRQPTQALVGGRYPVEQATELIFGRPAGIKTVISFGDLP